jgi:F-type H+-transporting ATPase subunit epsilon
MADDNLFAIDLVTPERILLTGLASEVILRTAEGDVTFLAGHTPLVGTVEPGVLRVVRAEGAVERVAVHGGFVQVEQGVSSDEGGDDDRGSGTRVTLLIGVAELAEEIDTERARAALEAAEARLSELGGTSARAAGSGAGSGEADEPDADVVEAEAALRRAEVRLEASEAAPATTA